jgi:PAS domain S-box-containing protein
MSPHGRILNANNALVNCLKFPDAKLISDVRLPDFFIDPADAQRYDRLIGKEGEVHDFETLIQCHDGSTIWVNINARMVLGRKGNPLAQEGSLEDITLRKHSEEVMKKKLMKFKLEEGNVYLVKEVSPTLALEALQDLQTIGYRGTIISRTSEKDWLRVVGKDFNYLWLAERGGKKSIKPDFDTLSTFLSSFTRTNVLLMDRIDYLIFKNDFESSLKFIQDLREQASLKKFIIILSIDPLLLKTREMRMFEKECKEIESTHKSILSDDLLRVLRFINKQNTIGIKPSYSIIAKELRISRPTVRKRLTLLASTGYVIEHARGNSKVLELTERGREMFWK